MKTRLIEQVGPSTRLRVMDVLKRTPEGLPVRAISDRLGMSYMGVKDICIDLHKRGLLTTWRHPIGNGRPQMLYRLTPKAQELFPTATDALTLDLLRASQQLFGESAAEKLLLVAFRSKAERYQQRVKGEILRDRAASLAKLRDSEGSLCELVETPTGEVELHEHHSPLLDVLQAFPIVAKLEAELFTRVLGVPVRREEGIVAGQFLARFILPAGT